MAVVATHAGVITANNLVRTTIVLAEYSMQQRFARTA